MCNIVFYHVFALVVRQMNCIKTTRSMPLLFDHQGSLSLGKTWAIKVLFFKSIFFWLFYSYKQINFLAIKYLTDLYDLQIIFKHNFDSHFETGSVYFCGQEIQIFDIRLLITSLLSPSCCECPWDWMVKCDTLFSWK